MAYPSDLLSTRAVVKPGQYAVIPENGLVNNVIPGWQDCKTSILTSPKIGAGFVMYITEAAPGGGATLPFAAGDGEEGFLYVVHGACRVVTGGQPYPLEAGGYLYAPPGQGMVFCNSGDAPAKILLYKQKYVPLENRRPTVCTGNAGDIPFRVYEDMDNVHIKDLLPADLDFDMNFHVLSFAPGGCHPIVETHVQEHGAYMLSGQGMYLLDDRWMGIRQGDFVWFGPYVPQAAYGVGTGPFTYIYSKDCNRDIAL